MIDFVCAISGVAAPGVEDDGEDAHPVGWASVTIATRTENPEWKRMIEARGMIVAQQLAPVAEKEREAARPYAEMIARASFAALEATVPRYIVEEDEVHVSAGQLPKLLELLGLEEAG